MGVRVPQETEVEAYGYIRVVFWPEWLLQAVNFLKEETVVPLHLLNTGQQHETTAWNEGEDGEIPSNTAFLFTPQPVGSVDSRQCY